MRLKLDENIGARDTDWLRTQEHDVETVADEHLTGAPDEEIHAAAAKENRSLVTLDVDFSDPIRFPPSQTAGTIVLRHRRARRPVASLHSSAVTHLG